MGTEKRKKSNPDGESRMQLDKPEVDNEERFGAPSTSISHSEVEPRAVTTPEAVEQRKAIEFKREQIEVGNIMELSITGQVLGWAEEECRGAKRMDGT